MNRQMLFWGINLNRLFDEAINLPLEIGERFDRDIVKLQQLAESNELSAAMSSESGSEKIHIGIYLRDNYVQGQKIEGEGRGSLDEPVRYESHQICNLMQDPAPLIERMNRIGIDVEEKDFGLYGFVWDE
jgi:hypothetical protein